MARRLDFVVMGLPRGGTTAVARYLSAVPEIHCGIEVFPTYLDHASLSVPEGFLAHDDPHWLPASVNEVTQRQNEIRWYGNKTPTYFYRLPTLLAQLDDAPAIVCLRDLRAVASSYNARAANPKDLSWDPGRVGLFAIGDALLLLHALAACPARARVLLVPQSALLNDWRAVMERAVAHVAPGAAPDFDPCRVRGLVAFCDRLVAPPPLRLDLAERRAFTRLDQDGVTDFFADPTPRLLTEVRAGLEALLESAPASPIRFVQRHLESHGTAEAHAFFPTWLRHATRASRLYGLKGRRALPL